MPGDRAKWVGVDAPSCESTYDKSGWTTVVVDTDTASTTDTTTTVTDPTLGTPTLVPPTSATTLSAKFSIPPESFGTLVLCYKFNYEGQLEPKGSPSRVPARPYQLFPNIRASVIGFTGRAPRATALNCSTQLLIRGEGFLTLAAMVPGGASNIHCNFSNVEGGVLPPSELHALPSPDVANTTVLYNYSTSGVAIVNDTHLYCATPRSIRTGALPVRLDVGEHGYYTASLPGALLQDEFHVYDPQDR